ncbi:MAG: NAD-dependent epimerase/dehydratase family protein [Actinobacteria bacterium]|nr:NAD-dependent epimerase/dehydratase family protein [Actinomycetota bacterium]
MRALVTGGNGFVGARLVAKLRGRGDGVVALVRSAERGAALAGMGAELVVGDVTDRAALDRAVAGCDAVFHVAGAYRIGIPARERPAMFGTNVTGTARVIDAAVAAGVARVVYVSTINVFGNTRGVVVDETYRRPGEDFVSYYDETKYRAHVVAEERIASGAPIIIAQPGNVYGPGDHSAVGGIIDDALAGRHRIHMFPEAGLTMAHVDDVADGLILAHDRGQVGAAYVIGGPNHRLGEVAAMAARAGGHTPTTRVMPRALVRASAPFGRVVGRVLGLPPNLREIISATANVTYWASSAKAEGELGYAPRDFATGLTDPGFTPPA